MRNQYARFCPFFAFATIAIMGATQSHAATEKILHQFDQLGHGNFVNGVVSDASGNLYGTGIYGGVYNHGLVFELAPNQHGEWTETVLYSFTGGSDGGYPESSVTLDATGNIYGTTSDGGASNTGTVFQLAPNGRGGWNETVLHSFAGGNDGEFPRTTITLDAAGNVYGSTYYGGASDYGVVFELVAASAWSENILHTFTGGGDGGYPGNLVLDAKGNLYGPAQTGGTGANGLVFELSPAAGGAWTENIIYQFAGGNDGSGPGSLLFDTNGNLFGTTSTGGTGSSCYTPNQGCGIVFELTPQSGAWKKTTLYNFSNSQSIGIAIEPSLSTFDRAGNLYGITYSGGNNPNCYNGCGSVFELSPASGGQWTETQLYNFSVGSGGYNPVGGLALGSEGQLYGSNSLGGDTLINGTVFALRAAGTGPWKLTTLYDFPFSDGAAPYTSLLPAGSGAFYGTTSYGGTYDVGTVFKMTTAGKGMWKETGIYSFGSGRVTGVNGVAPSSLISDSSGNLYGTTAYGGSFEFGTVFELSPGAGGSWTEKDLYTFSGLAYPQAGLIFDPAGNLYGTTSQGGLGHGMVFELSPGAGGIWTETDLYYFKGYPADGGTPFAALLRDAAGNLYGTTQFGGSSTNCVGGAGRPVGCGTVFELSFVSGAWQEKVLYSFLGSTNDGANPLAALLSDGKGNLFGTTAHGGVTAGCYTEYNKATCGTVFELSPQPGGAWTEKVLYEFQNSNGDGGSPIAGLVSDTTGNLYGTTSQGGAFTQSLCRGGCGAAFELSPQSGGGWTETVLHSFGSGYDGTYPAANLVFDSAGNLYGTTGAGGNAGVGVLFEITP